MFQPCRLIFSTCILIVASGHSVVRQPIPWKRRESKIQPCGGASMPTTLVNNAVEQEKVVDVLWEVTAGDGNGDVSIKVAYDDGVANNNFLNADTITITTRNGQPVSGTGRSRNGQPVSGTGKYQFRFTAPVASKCKGGPNNDACHFSFRSTSGWYSCITLRIFANTAAPTSSPTATKCQTLPANAKMCKGISTATELASTMKDLSVVLTNIEQFLKFNSKFLNVYRDPSRDCLQKMEKLLCADSFSLCKGEPNICMARCKIVESVCDLDPTHELAVGCFKNSFLNLDANQQADVYGNCPSLSSVPKRKIHLQNRFIYWKNPTDSDRYEEFKVWKGDVVHFLYNLTQSSLYQFPNKIAYDSCIFISATLVGNEINAATPNGVEWQAPLAEYTSKTSYYFGSKTNCVANTEVGSQKVVVTVLPFPDGATTIPLVKIPDEIPGDGDPADVGSAPLIFPFCWWLLFHFAIIE